MNMPVKVEYFKNPKNRDLTPAELDAFAKELDQIKQEVLDDLSSQPPPRTLIPEIFEE